MTDSLKDAADRFSQAQVLAMEQGDEFKELIAIGLQEMAAALDSHFYDLGSRLQDLEQLVRNRD